MEFAGALVAKPNENVGRVSPKEGTHFSRDLDCIVDAESLQSLNVKRSIVKIAVRAFVPVHTLPLAKHLPGHDDSPYFLAPHRAKYRTVNKVSGFNY